MNLSKWNGLEGKVSYANRITERKGERDAAQVKKDFYHSAKWLRIRVSVLRDNPLCVRCSMTDYITEATEVDHVLLFSDKHDPLATDTDNLRGLCSSCHSEVTQEEKRRGAEWLRRYERGDSIESIAKNKYKQQQCRVDEDGYPL